MTSNGKHVYSYPVDPGRRCDVVMKGGITSGVVYPLTICRLAERFLLQNIGGTSAGAIAAAAAAAAEYGRRHQTGTGFAELEALPGWLGETAKGSSDSNLFKLFQPRASTRSLFALLVAAISNPGPTVAFEILFSALWNWPRRALVGAALGFVMLALLFFALVSDRGALSIVALFAGVLAAVALMLIGAVAAVMAGIYTTAPKALAANGFGICSGISDKPTGPASGTAASPAGGTVPAEPLTEWMHHMIARASGVAILTFGHLWATDQGPREIDLAMITTCLTLGRPYRLPLELTDAFYFNRQELTNYLPDDIVAHLAAHSGDTRTDPTFGPLDALPAANDLPILLAARLSLSFPLLLSTLPLYRLNEDQSFTRCLFSDGGICSNFPIEFFDSPLPRWPTFGVNLAGPVGSDGIDVWMPDTNLVHVPPGSTAITGIGGFTSAIGRSAQNWHDNQYVELAGYRDRIVQVRFNPGEGGLNLNMPNTLIDTLRDRGERAGIALVERFADGHKPDGTPYELDWNNHRRIRLRTALAALEDFTVTTAVGYSGDPSIADPPRRYITNPPPAGEQTYDQIAATRQDPPRYAELDPQQLQLTLAILAKVLPEARSWAAARGRDLPPQQSPSLIAGAPEPAPQLRITPTL